MIGAIVAGVQSPFIQLVPNAPTIGTATAGDSSASVAFTAAGSGPAATSFTAVSTPGGFTGTGSSSPVTVSGLTNGTSYTFKVYASNASGNSALSAASNAVTPVFVPSYVAVGHNTTPFISTYSWTDASGFGSKFANPATLPTQAVYGVAFNPSNSVISVAMDATPWISAYPWSSSGFGTKYTNPSTLPTNTGIVSTWSPTGNDVFFGSQVTPYIFAYPWSSGFGTKYANPATLPAGTTYAMSYNNVSNVIAVGHDNTPFISAYPWSSGFGTKYANPATLGSNGRGLNFSPDGLYLASNYANTSAPSYFNIVYPWLSGFGTAYARTVGQVRGEGGVAFNPTSDAVVYMTANSTANQRLEGFPWSVLGYGTKYSAPASSPSGNPLYGQTIAFSKSGNAFAIGVDASPYVEAYAFNKTSGYGTKYANPATLPTGGGISIAFNN